jgi:hypothetical protein
VKGGAPLMLIPPPPYRKPSATNESTSVQSTLSSGSEDNLVTSKYFVNNVNEIDSLIKMWTDRGAAVLTDASTGMSILSVHADGRNRFAVSTPDGRVKLHVTVRREKSLTRFSMTDKSAQKDNRTGLLTIRNGNLPVCKIDGSGNIVLLGHDQSVDAVYILLFMAINNLIQ